jgi:hypothetical protein
MICMYVCLNPWAYTYGISYQKVAELTTTSMLYNACSPERRQILKAFTNKCQICISWSEGCASVGIHVHKRLWKGVSTSAIKCYVWTNARVGQNFGDQQSVKSSWIEKCTAWVKWSRGRYDWVGLIVFRMTPNRVLILQNPDFWFVLFNFV